MRWLVAVVCLTAFAVGLSSCSLPFYWQAANGQLELLRRREPIPEILADPQTPTELKAALTDVERIRRFAIEELLLPDNGSYQTYADLGRDYVVWNVVAAEPFSVAPQQWCFPFAGCVAYRGFFDRGRAEAFESKLGARGLDTYSGGSGAYSTLGYFADPVLNTMIGSATEEIASILIHELAHQRVYVKGDSELSEAFASTVEEFGTRVWLRRTEDTAGLARYERRLQSRAAFARLITEQQARLADIYARPLADADKLAAKAAAFEQLREQYAAARAAEAISPGYDAWFAQDLNNATLAAVATYRRWVPALRGRLQQRGLVDFYADVERLAAAEEQQRAATLHQWDAAANDPGLQASVRQ